MMKKKLFSGFIASMFSISILSSIFIHTSMVQAIELTNDNSSITTSTEETSDIITLSTTHPTETTITTIKTTIVTTAPQKIDEKNTALEKLAIKERRLVGKFERERAVLLGELDSDATRLTINDVQNIIDNSDSFNEIWQKLKEAQPYPDYYGGSGITNIEYWFDDRGEQKIMLIKPQEDILYVNCTEDGTVKDWDKIYSKGNNVDFIQYQSIMIDSFIIYNDITLKNPLISVEDILLLSKKHDELSWSDFENYDYSDIGDGSYIWEFNIKDSSSKLLIGGKDFREKPDYIILSMRTGVEVDVRKDDLTPWFYDDSSSIKGDTNCDGTVDMADAVLIMQALANPNKYGINGTADHHLTEQGKLNGDMDGDGLTVGDAQEIQKELLGLKLNNFIQI